MWSMLWSTVTSASACATFSSPACVIHAFPPSSLCHPVIRFISQMCWSADIVRKQLHPEVPHCRHDWVASRHLQGRPTRQELALLSSVVGLSSAFSISSHVHCIICFLHQHLLDSCVRESDDDHNSADYHVILRLSHTSNEINDSECAR